MPSWGSGNSKGPLRGGPAHTRSHHKDRCRRPLLRRASFQRPTSIQNVSDLPQGLAGYFAAG